MLKERQARIPFIVQADDQGEVCCNRGHAPSKSSIDLILIGGVPRSGTTLTARVIGENFRIPMSPETHYFSYAHRGDKLATENLPKETLNDYRVAAAYGKISGRSRSVETFRTLLKEIHGSSAILGEKTPAHLTSFTDILSDDQNVICIVVVRDFFAVTESLRNVSWSNPSFIMNLRRCARYFRMTHLAQKRFPQRLIVLKYETLCRDEEGTISALTSILPQGNFKDKQNFFDPKIEPWKRDALLPPQARFRKVPNDRILHWLFAKAIQCACCMRWPIRFLKPHEASAREQGE